MRKLTLAEADTIIDAALAKGRELDLGRLAVVVLDDGGHPIAMKREDGSEFLRPQIASAKAWGALGMGLPSRLLHERAKKLPDFIGALSDISGGRVVALPGGVIIRDTEGVVLGAVGVSGDVSEPDEVCAVAGVEAAGLQADIGQNSDWRRPTLGVEVTRSSLLGNSSVSRSCRVAEDSSSSGWGPGIARPQNLEGRPPRSTPLDQSYMMHDPSSRLWEPSALDR